MSTMHCFTSESVSEGHPDKVCDQISDAILDSCILSDPDSRVACECLATTDFLVISGEISSKATPDFEKIARKVINGIGYNSPELGFDGNTAAINVRLHAQSRDIARGVDSATSQDNEQGAGDQGMMFGFACDETDTLMPAPIYYSHRIMERFAQLRHSGAYPFLRPDAKTQITFVYDGSTPVAVKNIVLSHQHSDDMPKGVLMQLAKDVANEIIPAKYMQSKPDFFVNYTGNFVIGGPDGDTGLTGRKIIVDTYGGMGRHGGGAFSGKDPSKVDRSAAYMARHVAKNIVAAGLAKRCEIQVAYVIGHSTPLNITVDTFGTGKVADEKLSDFLEGGTLFDFKPASIIDALSLKHPNGWCYQKTAAYGHFGRNGFPWENTDKAAALAAAF